MKIVVDTQKDITQLFKKISEEIKINNDNATCILDNCIIVSADSAKTRKAVAESISQFIVKEFEGNLAESILKPFELPKSEVDDIIDLLASDRELMGKRISILNNEISAALRKGHINIDGLVKFRLENYKKELQFTIELLIDELSAQKSYDEFIGLMKYFTEIQAPVTETVILSEKGDDYLLTDSSGKPINLRFDEEFADELMPFDLSGEDLLISNLMAAMPKKIVFDNINRNKPIIKTITRIFEGRIVN